MKVKNYLSEVKANRYTYYNLDKKAIKDFQDSYNYLKRHKDKKVGLVWLYKYYINPHHSEYTKKYKLMNVISQSIIH